MRCSHKLIKSKEGAWEPLIYSQGVRSTGNNLGLRLASEEGREGRQSCRTELLNCGICRYLQVDKSENGVEFSDILLVSENCPCSSQPLRNPAGWKLNLRTLKKPVSFIPLFSYMEKLQKKKFMILKDPPEFS